jgi:predicted  nucleic acid-binding Zn-ribbon protein
MSNTVVAISADYQKVLQEIQKVSDLVLKYATELTHLEREVTSLREEFEASEANNGNLGKDFAELSKKVAMIQGTIDSMRVDVLSTESTDSES